MLDYVRPGSMGHLMNSGYPKPRTRGQEGYQSFLSHVSSAHLPTHQTHIFTLFSPIILQHGLMFSWEEVRLSKTPLHRVLQSSPVGSQPLSDFISSNVKG